MTTKKATKKATKKTETVVDNSRPISLLAADALRKMQDTIWQLPFYIIGDTDMLMHRWALKAFLEMLGNMVGIKMPKEPKDLMEDYEASWYRNIDQELVIPCRLLKACIVEGAITTGKTAHKTDLKRYIRVVGATSPITLAKGTEREMQIDLVKVGNGLNKKPDVRARARIPTGWRAEFVLQFPMSYSPDSVVCALEGAGRHIGLCDWRFEKGGEYGGFKVGFFPAEEETHHVNRILRLCSKPEDQFDIPPQYLRAYNAASPEVQKKALKKISPMQMFAEASVRDAERAKKKNVSHRSNGAEDGASA